MSAMVQPKPYAETRLTSRLRTQDSSLCLKKYVW